MWTLVGVNVVLFGFHYWALWILASTFAAGLVAWASALFFLGPLIALAAISASLWMREGKWILSNLAVIVAYAALWLPPLLV